MKLNYFTNSFFSIFYNENYLIRYGIYCNIKDIAPKANGTLLDFGCGNKPYKSLFANVQNYIGLDYESTKHNNISETNTDLVYNGKDIPIEDGEIDFILSTEVFEHVFDIQSTLSELYRVLKPGGEVFITCPFSYPEHEQPYDFARYTTFGLNHIIEKNNFTDISIKKHGTFLMVLLQYLALYIYYFISKIPLIKFLLFPILISPIFIFSILIHNIVPNNLLKKNLYLTNIAYFRKPL